MLYGDIFFATRLNCLKFNMESEWSFKRHVFLSAKQLLQNIIGFQPLAIADGTLQYSEELKLWHSAEINIKILRNLKSRQFDGS